MTQATRRLTPATTGRVENAAKWSGIAVTLAFHVVVIVLLLRFEPVRSALTQAAPIVVRLVSPPPKLEKPDEPPKPLPPKPRIERPKPVPKPPLMTAVTEAQPSFVAPPPPPVPVIEAPAEPLAVAPAAPPAPPAKPAPAPVPVVPPSFNADYLNNPAPAYPALSRRMGEEGRVILRVLVNEQGLPKELQLKTSSGFSRLDSVALETVRQWRFVPARRGDQPIAAWVLVPISFSLRS